jgi:hypothetical protein
MSLLFAVKERLSALAPAAVKKGRKGRRSERFGVKWREVPPKRSETRFGGENRERS